MSHSIPFRAAWLPIVLFVAACGGAPEPPPSAPAAPAATVVDPAQAVEALLLADRTFAAVSADVDVASGLTAMFADDVVMAVTGQPFAMGKAAARAALEAHPANLESRASWTPARAGISADGLHGFTWGYMTVTQSDETVTPGKYLAYWVKGPGGWRVAVYRRGPRPEGDVPAEMLPPALPPRMVAPTTDEAALAALRAELEAVERAFSDEAQVIGLGPAFVKYGSADAVHMGEADDVTFVAGADAIGRSVSAGQPERGGSTLSWGPDQSLVASSGDLGVTIGRIVTHPVVGQEERVRPFFTIWRRAGPGEPWRYVAE